MAGIYIASKTKHAAHWKEMRTLGCPIISTWLDEVGEGESADLHDLWERCIAEVSRCSAMVLYREPGEVLKGAWIELGVALSLCVPVFAVGIEEYSVAKFRGIKHYSDIRDAFAAALTQHDDSAKP